MCGDDQRFDELRQEIVDQVARLGVKLDAVAFEMRSRNDKLIEQQGILRGRIDSIERQAVTKDGLAESLLNAGVITSDSLGDVLWNSLRVSSMRALKAIVTIGGAIGLIVAVVSWLLRIAFGGG